MSKAEFELKNEILISGELYEYQDTFESFGKTFHQIIVGVKRLSNTIDYIPVVFRDIPNKHFIKGDFVKIVGTIRTRNIKVENRMKLIIYIYAKYIDLLGPEDTLNVNDLTIEGYICKPVEGVRETPFKQKLTDILLANNDAKSRKSYYIPVITFNQEAERASNLAVGDCISVVGRFQSREYTKVNEDGTSINKLAYEIASRSFSIINTNS